jgi:hypothetical protein
VHTREYTYPADSLVRSSTISLNPGRQFLHEFYEFRGSRSCFNAHGLMFSRVKDAHVCTSDGLVQRSGNVFQCMFTYQYFLSSTGQSVQVVSYYVQPDINTIRSIHTL